SVPMSAFEGFLRRLRQPRIGTRDDLRATAQSGAQIVPGFNRRLVESVGEPLTCRYGDRHIVTGLRNMRASGTRPRMVLPAEADFGNATTDTL
ncbi:MAG: hypothetical protein QHJ82_15005, partial [Verrucomicrobiota bacterium]|nr:hypothetical protein [Verrucomicrobiota bacterium]